MAAALLTSGLGSVRAVMSSGLAAVAPIRPREWMMAWRSRGDSSVRAVRKSGVNLESRSLPIAVADLARTAGLGSLMRVRQKLFQIVCRSGEGEGHGFWVGLRRLERS
jgi:hypothetical protein